ncbi:MAG TPA: ribonuclease III [Thermodesulfobacteriota bacterium]|nr:ribonuclease III [Thermodesulfobacteriota bacterium]
MDKERKKALRELQKKFNYRFKSPALLNQSLRHKSYVHENLREEKQDNERMEFLGDAVLGLVIGHLIMDRYPDYPEGSLSRLRAAVVNETRLAEIARDLSLGDYLLLGKGEEMTRGRQKSSILASSLEAVLAAVYLDGGLKKAFKVITHLFSVPLDMAEKESFYQDFKTKLQEFSQEVLKATPRYVMVKEFGPDHRKVFGAKVLIQGKVAGVGAGKSKKEAEQRAAQKTLNKLHQEMEKRNGG